MSDITKHQGDQLPKKQRTLGEALNDLVHDLHGVKRGSHYLQPSRFGAGVTLGPDLKDGFTFNMDATHLDADGAHPWTEPSRSDAPVTQDVEYEEVKAVTIDGSEPTGEIPGLLEKLTGNPVVDYDHKAEPRRLGRKEISLAEFKRLYFDKSPSLLMSPAEDTWADHGYRFLNPST